MGYTTRDCVLRGVNFNMRYVQSEGRPRSLDDELTDKRVRSYGRQTEINASAVWRLKGRAILL